MVDVPGFQQLVSTLQQLVLGLNNLTQTVSSSTSAIYPQTQGVSTIATAGAIVSPGDFLGFMDVKLPDGTTVKVPYFAP